MNCILGLDFGSKTVGVAVSDPLGFTAQGLTIIRREKKTTCGSPSESLRSWLRSRYKTVVLAISQYGLQHGDRP
jgi:RNase H-fold protein (predicted Holliday junction resolvase)